MAQKAPQWVYEKVYEINMKLINEGYYWDEVIEFWQQTINDAKIEKTENNR